MGSAFGKYELIAELGHGGISEVFLALHEGPARTGFRKLLVVKRLRHELVDDPEFSAMLLDEARIIARLNHPNVVQTIEAGTVEDRYFIAMEYLDGQPLRRILSRSRKRAEGDPPFDIDQQVVVLIDVLAGLHHAHELTDFAGRPLEVVHRDVSPRNVFVTYGGQVKLVDFGMAKAADRTIETRQGIVKGKIAHMAPEQALGLATTRRVDIFAVGVMLYEMTLGVKAWGEKEDFEILRALVAGQMPKPAREVDPTVSVELDRIISRAMAPRPEERYATAEEFRADLEEYLRIKGVLVEARRRIGPTTAELFKEAREHMSALIERHLGPGRVAEPDDSPPDSSSASGTLLMQLAPPPLSLAPARASAPPQTPSVPNVARNIAPAPAPAPARGRASPIVVGVLAGLALLFCVALWRGLRARQSVASAPHSEPETAAGVPVRVRVQATPGSARVRVDDGLPYAVPFERSFPRDERPHVLRFEAPGYDERVENVRFNTDLQITVDLEKQSDAGPTASVNAAQVAPKPPPLAGRPSLNVKSARRPEAPAPPPGVPVRAEHAPANPSSTPPKRDPLHVDKEDPWRND